MSINTIARNLAEDYTRKKVEEKIAHGLAQAKRGETIDGEEAFRQLREHSVERRREREAALELCSIDRFGIGINFHMTKDRKALWLLIGIPLITVVGYFLFQQLFVVYCRFVVGCSI